MEIFLLSPQNDRAAQRFSISGQGIVWAFFPQRLLSFSFMPTGCLKSAWLIWPLLYRYLVALQVQDFCWIFASSLAPIMPQIGLYGLKYKAFSIIQCTLLYTPKRYSGGKFHNFPPLLSHVCPAAACFYGYVYFTS